MKKEIIAIGLLVFSLLIMVGCKDSTDNQNTIDPNSNMPSQMTWSVYEVGASGYAEMSAVANMITDVYGTNIRMLPSATGVGRMIPLRNGMASIAKLGDESQFAFEGVQEFSSPNWGPQDLRAIWSPITHYGLGVKANEGIEKIEDLKGKRVPYFPGNSSVNVKTEALLAFGGLTWEDVEVVELTAYSGQAEALLQGRIDVVSGIPSASAFVEAESKEGIEWLVMDPDYKEGWDRVEEVAPYLFSEIRDDGAGMDGNTPLLGYGYSIVSYADQENVKGVIRAIDENIEQLKSTLSTGQYYALEKVLTEPIGIPFHDETIEYFKEKGLWDEEKQAKNDALIERSKRLREAWKQVKIEAREKGISDDAFPEYWLERKEELVE